jgi:DNA-directed RNA polymerase subunit RPC12/RpoP
MTTPAHQELFCLRCGKKLSEHIMGLFVFLCPRCKTQLSGETKPLAGDFVVTAVTPKKDP